MLREKFLQWVAELLQLQVDERRAAEEIDPVPASAGGLLDDFTRPLQVLAGLAGLPEHRQEGRRVRGQAEPLAARVGRLAHRLLDPAPRLPAVAAHEQAPTEVRAGADVVPGIQPAAVLLQAA